MVWLPIFHMEDQISNLGGSKISILLEEGGLGLVWPLGKWSCTKIAQKKFILPQVYEIGRKNIEVFKHDTKIKAHQAARWGT